MKKVKSKLRLNKNVISTLNNVKGGNAASAHCPTFPPEASCPEITCGDPVTTANPGTALGCPSGHWYCA